MSTIPLNCRNCVYFITDASMEKDIGVCRRHPPVIVNLPGGDPGRVFSRFPPVNVLIWCGEHRKK